MLRKYPSTVARLETLLTFWYRTLSLTEMGLMSLALLDGEVFLIAFWGSQ